VAIDRESMSLRADYVLKPELREFNAVYESAEMPVVHIRIGLKLVRLPDKQIVAQRSFDADQVAQQNAVVPVVEAFNAALRRVMTDIVIWTLPAVGARG